MNSEPDTIVMMVTYNNEKDVSEALECFLSQSYKNFHLLLIDDASNDRTFEIAQTYQSRFPNVTMMKNEQNKGSVANIKYSLSCARSILPSAQFLLWACADDRWAPEFLIKTRAALLANPEAVTAFCNFEKINLQTGERQEQVLCTVRGESYKEAKKIFRPYKTEKGSANFNSVIHGLIRTSELPYIFPHSDSVLLAVFATELSCLISMLLRGQIVIVPETLFYKRRHGRFIDKNPLDDLSVSYRKIFRRSLYALSHLPRFFSIRKENRSLIFVVLMWMNLFYIYGLVATYVRLREVLFAKT